MKTNLAKSVIYQIYLRTFTAEGTLSAATKMIPHLCDLGIDIVYMSACCKEDNSVEHQSPRQIASGMNNPKNPYRMADYFDIDEEYGTLEDLGEFIETAHKYGIKVLIDLVYLHCGANAVFIAEHPDYVICNEDGTVAVGETWPFARLNYENQELREYMWSNMEFYIKDLNADGFRCDVGDQVPLDFWAEGVRRIKEINPDVIMLNEGEKTENLSVFDINYGFPIIYATSNLLLDAEAIEKGEEIKDREPVTVESFKALVDSSYENIPQGKFLLLNSENHDTVSDLAERRVEMFLGSDAAEAIMAMLFTMKGVPMIYNGCEVADSCLKNMFWNRFSAGTMSVQWQNALCEKGKKRLEFVKNIIRIHRYNDAITSGDIKWYNDCDENILAYTRESDTQKLIVMVNISRKTQKAILPEKIKKSVLEKNVWYDGDNAIIGSYGILIAEI